MTTTEPAAPPKPQRVGVARVKAEFMSLNARTDLALRRSMLGVSLGVIAVGISLVTLSLVLFR